MIGPPVTIACVWVTGHVPYSVDYVVKLKSMVRRHMGERPFEFVCLTDRPQELAGHCRPIIVKPYAGIWAWWTKLELFNPARNFVGRVCCLDLDNVVVADLSPIIDYPAPLAFVPPGGNFKPKGFKVVTRYNTSVIVFDPSDETARLYREFDPDQHARAGSLVRDPYWGDQDYIGDRIPDAATMPDAWFPRYSEINRDDNGTPLMRDAKVLLVKKPKPHVAAGYDRWLAKAWR